MNNYKRSLESIQNEDIILQSQSNDIHHEESPQINLMDFKNIPEIDEKGINKNKYVSFNDGVLNGVVNEDITK